MTNDLTQKNAAQMGSNGDRQIACPVCRAKQIAQPECRRCSADLALYLKAMRSVEESKRQFANANRNGDSQLAAQMLKYMQWLADPVELSLFYPQHLCERL